MGCGECVCVSVCACVLHVSAARSPQNASRPQIVVVFPFLNGWAGEPRLTAAIPTENPHCSCKLTAVSSSAERNITGITSQQRSGCYDGYGQTGADYALGSGLQMSTIRRMILTFMSM